MGVRAWSMAAFIAAAVIAGGHPAAAAEPLPAERLEAIETFLGSVHEALGIPGLALTVIQDGAPILTTTLGVADGEGRPVTAQTPFMLASTSKGFTALAVMQLVEAGRLDLDAPVQAVLPWFTLADPAAAAVITPRQLLHHTSGLSEASGTAYQGVDDQDPEALERGVRRLADEPLEAAPGERFIYSNTNYDILGLLVETLAGQPFSDAIESMVFEPLGMTHSHATVEAARADGLSEGFYPWFGGDWRPSRVALPRTGGPSATMFASIEDLGRAVMAHLGDGSVGTAEVLSAEGMATLHRPGVAIDEFAGYAMGWRVRPLWEILDPAQPADAGYLLPALVEHDGHWVNGRSFIGLLPSEGIGYALLLNGDDPTRTSITDSVNWSVIRLLAGRDAVELAASEDWLRQNARLVTLGIVIAEMVSFVLALAWIVRLLRRHTAPRTGRMVIALVAAGGLDLLVAYLLLVVAPEGYGLALDDLLRVLPDIALGAWLALALALIWGPIRTVIVLVLWARYRGGPIEPAFSGVDAATVTPAA